MDRGDHKLYHVHGFDSRSFLDTYFSDKEDFVFRDDSMNFPMKKLHSALSQGHIRGDSLIDISVGSFIHHLYSACDYFKEITLLRASERCIMELNKWRDTRTGAFEWSHTSQMLSNITGDSDVSQDNEIKLKAAIKQIMKCDLQRESLTDVESLPQADCVITACFLDVTCEDFKEYDRNLNKISNLLKPEGHLILFGLKNATYAMIGKEKFHVLKLDENYVTKVLTNEGFTIDHCEVQNRKAESDLTNYEGIIFIVAHK
ncbi:hypothetical protein PRIEUP_LOCUS609, partial [Pristimantis euphronides]